MTADLARMWEATPRANVGIATGSAVGLVVPDLDVQDALTYAMLDLLTYNGVADLAGLAVEKGISVPATYVVHTGRGGLHLCFRHRGPVPSGKGLAGLPSIDVLGDDAWVTGAGSVHPNDRTYRAEDPAAPVLDLSPALAELVAEPRLHPFSGARYIANLVAAVAHNAELLRRMAP